MNSKIMKLLFYNHTATVSGAERVLLLIVSQLDKTEFESVVLCPAGELQQLVEAQNVPCLTVENDPVERLRLGARQVVRAGQHGPMTRSGHQAYVVPSSPVPAEPKQRHLNIVR